MPKDGSATRDRILDTAERLVIEHGFSGTSVERIIAESGSSKGAFFHHFPSKPDLARHLVERYAAADARHLLDALSATETIADPGERLLAVLGGFEDDADALMSAQNSCLYVALLTERELVGAETRAPILAAIETWRTGVADLLRAALAEAETTRTVDCDAWADHVFVTFEGAFILCRSTADPTHMRRQLGVLRQAFTALLR